MGFSNRSESNSIMLSNNTKVIALESSLQQSIVKFKDLVQDFEQLHTDSENYRLQYISLKDKCENKTCAGAEEFKKIIETKDQIIQSIALMLTKLNETKNFSILSDAFKTLCGEKSPSTPPLDDIKNPSTSRTPAKNVTPDNRIVKKEVDTSITEDISLHEDSMGEIDGTPTGRISPIIHTKKTRSVVKSSGLDKKKCPSDWPTSESKAIKLIFSTPARTKTKGTGRLRQQRINLVKTKQTTVVDLTCSPEVAQKNVNGIQLLIKKEPTENDDTIQPSPTSGPTNFTFLKITSKPSPVKFRKPPLSLKSRSDNVTKQDENRNILKDTTQAGMDESINILFANRLRYAIMKEVAPVKMEVEPSPEKKTETPAKVDVEAPHDEDITHCEISASISLLQEIDKIEAEHMKCSPSKGPLMENINVMNTPSKNDAESSMSILQPEPIAATVENIKRKIPELVEPVYKEPTVRNKAEKRNLQGWSCEECEKFFGVLYKDDPVMLARKINECSKHRGKHNPVRPKTPPNFWNPRWEVPDNTEELNRMNNAN